MSSINRITMIGFILLFFVSLIESKGGFNGNNVGCKIQSEYLEKEHELNEIPEPKMAYHVENGTISFEFNITYIPQNIAYVIDFTPFQKDDNLLHTGHCSSIMSSLVSTIDYNELWSHATNALNMSVGNKKFPLWVAGLNWRQKVYDCETIGYKGYFSIDELHKCSWVDTVCNEDSPCTSYIFISLITPIGKTQNEGVDYIHWKWPYSITLGKMNKQEMDQEIHSHELRDINSASSIAAIIIASVASFALVFGSVVCIVIIFKAERNSVLDNLTKKRKPLNPTLKGLFHNNKNSEA